MGRQIRGLLYFFVTDVRYSFMIFWGILLTILIISIALTGFLGNTEFYFGLSISVYIYCGILGFLTVKESVPFSIKIGAARKNLFIGVGILFVALALVNAIVANTLHAVTLFLLENAGMHTFGFLHPAMLFQDTWFNRVIIDTSFMFFLFTFMFVLGLLFYKYGLAGGGFALGSIVVILLVGIAQGWLIDFFKDLAVNIDLTIFYQMLGIGFVIFCISFLFLRKITTVKVR